jgi:hypothetical protein
MYWNGHRRWHPRLIVYRGSGIGKSFLLGLLGLNVFFGSSYEALKMGLPLASESRQLLSIGRTVAFGDHFTFHRRSLIDWFRCLAGLTRVCIPVSVQVLSLAESWCAAASDGIFVPSSGLWTIGSNASQDRLEFVSPFSVRELLIVACWSMVDFPRSRSVVCTGLNTSDCNHVLHRHTCKLHKHLHMS